MPFDAEYWRDRAEGSLSNAIEFLGMMEEDASGVKTVEVETAGYGRYRVTIERMHR